MTKKTTAAPKAPAKPAKTTKLSGVALSEAQLAEAKGGLNYTKICFGG